MKGAKELLSEYLTDYILTDKQLEKLHKVLFEIMCDIDTVCKKYNLLYFLSGGTLLGAVRHKGFIPWDDDVDIMMLRDDYDKLGECILKEFPNKYEVKYEMETELDATGFLKIYLNGTKYVEVANESWDKPKKIFVDVFAIESSGKYNAKAKRQRRQYTLISRMKNLRLDAVRPPEKLISVISSNKKLRRYYRLRVLLGNIARILPTKYYYNKIRKLTNKYNPQSEFIHIPVSSVFQFFKREVFEDTIEVEFEGKKFPAPIGYIEYLTMLYGDYMRIPPENERERHMAFEVDFGNFA